MVVVAIAGSVWFAVGGSDVRTITVVETVIVEKPVTITEKIVETVVVEKVVEGQSVKVVETVIVEKPVTIIEKIVETVVVEKMVEGKVVVVLQTVIVEKPVTRVEKVVETVVVEKAVQVVPTTMPAAEMAPPAATAAPQPTAMPAATGVPALAPRPTGTPMPPPVLSDPDPEQRSLPNQPGATTFEDYERQPLTDASEDAVSTFSLDTDRTSFQLALNWARSGYQVDPASVRAEEWGERIRLRLCRPFSRRPLRHHVGPVRASARQRQVHGAGRLQSAGSGNRRPTQRDAGARRLRLDVQRQPGGHRSRGG